MTDEQQRHASPPPFPPPPDANSPFDRPTFNPPTSNAPTTGIFPLDIGRAFELTFSMFRNRWRTFVAISIVAQAITTVASLTLLLNPQATLFTDFTGRTPTQAELEAFFAGLWPAFLLSLAFFLVVLLVGNIQIGAMTDVVGRIYAGKPVGAFSSLGRASRRWVTLLALMVLLLLGALAVFLVGAMVGTLALFVLTVVVRSLPLVVFFVLILYVAMIAALIFVAVRWSMAVQVVMLESLGARAAMGRSWRLIAGSTWRVIGYYLIFALLAIVISLIIGTAVNILVNPYEMSGFRIVAIDWSKLAIATVLSALLGAFVAPLTAIPAILLYLDLRFRRGDYIQPPGQGSLTASGHDGSVSE